MNEDRVFGTSRTILGDAEVAVGRSFESEHLVQDGVAHQVAGHVQNGLGIARDVIDDVPDALAEITDRGRTLARQADAAVRRELGDNGPLYLLAGAAALLGLGLFAFTRGRSAPTTRRRRTAAAKTTTQPRKRAPRTASPRARKPQAAKA